MQTFNLKLLVREENVDNMGMQSVIPKYQRQFIFSGPNN
jgi:hypothetical protein